MVGKLDQCSPYRVSNSYRLHILHSIHLEYSSLYDYLYNNLIHGIVSRYPIVLHSQFLYSYIMECVDLLLYYIQDLLYYTYHEQLRRSNNR